MFGFFENLFDTNHDGKLDTLEKTSQIGATTYLLDQDEEESLIQETGLDVIDLELMDEEDRKEAIEAAGLDPLDYEDDF